MRTSRFLIMRKKQVCSRFVMRKKEGRKNENTVMFINMSRCVSLDAVFYNLFVELFPCSITVKVGTHYVVPPANFILITCDRKLSILRHKHTYHILILHG